MTCWKYLPLFPCECAGPCFQNVCKTCCRYHGDTGYMDLSELVVPPKMAEVEENKK